MASKEYRFIEETHCHMIGGVVVPGITTCIKPLYDFSAVPEHIMKAAGAYGSAVHKAVELYCLGTLDMEDLDPVLVPSVCAFQTWLDLEKIDKADLVVEVPMGDPALQYGGIPDLILDGSLIVELKTRKVNMLTDSIQCAAQESLWKKNGGIRTKEYERRILELKQDGTYSYTRVNDKQAWPKFRLLLDHYHNSQTINYWKGK